MRVRFIDRYVTREFLRLFVLFVTSAPLLFILGDLMDNLDRYMDRGLSTVQVGLSYLFQLPLFVLYSFPIAALIAAVFTVSNMTRHFEVVAAKAGGISFYRLFAALPALGIALTLAALALSELVPVANRLRSEALGEQDRGRSGRSDFVYRASDGRVFAIRRLDVEGSRIDGVSMEREGNEPAVPGVNITAVEAVHDSATGWTLRDGHYRLFLGPDKERTFRFSSMRLNALTETPRQLLAEPRDPEDMRYAELGEFIEILERSGGRPLKLRTEQAQKIALPVATLVIILFAMPLATSSRRGGSAYGVGISLAITIFYLMLFKITGAAGASGALPPVVAAWIPNAAFAIAAAVLISRIRT